MMNTKLSQFSPDIRSKNKKTLTLFCYRQLLHELEGGAPQPRSRQSPSDSEGSEHGWLRDEHDHLEARQEILQAHNRQLELQLQRLKLLLKQVSSFVLIVREFPILSIIFYIQLTTDS